MNRKIARSFLLLGFLFAADKLVAMLRKGHEKVELSREEMIRLVTWIDANAPYYGTWDGRRNVKYKDLPDFRPSP